jgi:hypothetical protein
MEACTTHELYVESFRVAKFPSPRYTDIFEACDFNPLPAPFERSKWGLDLEHACSKEDVIFYCEAFFLTASPGRTERFSAGMRANPSFSRSSFEERCLEAVTHLQGDL